MRAHRYSVGPEALASLSVSRLRLTPLPGFLGRPGARKGRRMLWLTWAETAAGSGSSP